jgi:membrane protein DedA with SNARE-associated domain
MLQSLISFLVNTISQFGYLGIVIMMFLESSFFPFPSEIVIIPAGYLAFKGDMNIFLVILFGIVGSYTGAIFNYILAAKFGRPFLIKYGKYFFITHETLDKLDLFFEKHGHISTFNGRLIPGIRQYISLPAGLSKMNITIFSVYTIFGAGIWVTFLAFLGYYLGQNQDLISKYLHTGTIVVLILISIISFLYYLIYKNKKRRINE